MSSRRRLTLADGTWRYRVGAKTVELWTPGGRKIFVEKWRVTTGTQPEWQESCSEGDGLPVTPGLLRKYIEESLDRA